MTVGGGVLDAVGEGTSVGVFVGAGFVAVAGGATVDDADALATGVTVGDGVPDWETPGWSEGVGVGVEVGAAVADPEAARTVAVAVGPVLTDGSVAVGLGRLLAE